MAFISLSCHLPRRKFCYLSRSRSHRREIFIFRMNHRKDEVTFSRERFVSVYVSGISGIGAFIQSDNSIDNSRRRDCARDFSLAAFLYPFRDTNLIRERSLFNTHHTHTCVYFRRAVASDCGAWPTRRATRRERRRRTERSAARTRYA